MALIKKFNSIDFSWPAISRSQLLAILSYIISANIAFFLYNSFGWPEGYWSVVSVAALMTADLHNSFGKMILRLIGTIVGAIYAYLTVHFFSDHIVFLVLLLAIGVFLSSIISLQSPALSYAGIVGNITVIMIIATSIASGNFYEMTIARTFEVCLGIIITAIVNFVLLKLAVSSHSQPQWFIKNFTQITHGIKNIRLEKSIYVAAIKVVIAAAVTFVPWFYLRYPGGFWATISCFFIIEESLTKTQQKALFRLLAHVFASAFGLLSAIIIGDHLWLLCIPLTIGLLVCGYILSHGKVYSSMGNTMGIALGVMLLAEPGTQGSL